MEGLVKGDVVVVSFPFTDLSGFSKRPALVIRQLEGDDTILCQITSSQSRKDKYAIELNTNNFSKGKLPKQSLIRINKLFTASKNIILKKVGSLEKEFLEKVEHRLISLLKE